MPESKTFDFSRRLPQNDWRSLFQRRIFLIALLLCSAFCPLVAQRPATSKNHPLPAKIKRVLYLPLDERFTTRDLFLAFGGITPFQIVTPAKSQLSAKKATPEIRTLLDWTRKTAAFADAAVISAEMLLYGGLIGSRTGTEPLAEIQERLQIFRDIRREHQQLPIYVSTTVMRMPAYSSADEEPDYYAEFGRQIFLFSEATHRYEVKGIASDKAAADEYRRQIPPAVLEDYLARRTRNFAINRELIELVKNGVIDRLVTTLDDNAEYGLFKKEAQALAEDAAGFDDRIAIYSGADEAQLPLLARLRLGNKKPKVFVAYRYPQSKNLIPAFEGQPLADSIAQQIAAAGGAITDNQDAADCILFVNNFREKESFPPKDAAFPPNAEPLEKWLKDAGINLPITKTLILADNNYYNGADAELIAALFACRLPPERLAYAGWNTSGNALGTAISLGFLRYAFKENSQNLQIYKKLLWARLIEDWVYMTEGRELIRNDLRKRKLANFEINSPLEKEYETQMRTLFNARGQLVNRFLKTDFAAADVFFPWHRSFEVGFSVISKSRKKTPARKSR